jgi:hypothetical protein
MPDHYLDPLLTTNPSFNLESLIQSGYLEGQGYKARTQKPIEGKHLDPQLDVFTFDPSKSALDLAPPIFVESLTPAAKAVFAKTKVQLKSGGRADYSFITNTISLPDPAKHWRTVAGVQETIAHELGHAAQNAGLMSKQDMEAILGRIGKSKVEGYRGRYASKKAPPILDDFGRWVDNRKARLQFGMNKPNEVPAMMLKDAGGDPSKLPPEVQWWFRNLFTTKSFIDPETYQKATAAATADMNMLKTQSTQNLIQQPTTTTPNNKPPPPDVPTQPRAPEPTVPEVPSMSDPIRNLRDKMLYNKLFNKRNT